MLFAKGSTAESPVHETLLPLAAPCSEATIKVDIMTDDYGDDTTWKIIELDTGDVLASGGPYDYGNTLYTDEICAESGKCYVFKIYDFWGDGMCCDYGNGYYAVYYNNTLKGSGGEFSNTEMFALSSGCDVSPPQNDDCANAIAVELDVPFNGKTVTATGSETTDCASDDTLDVWHSFIPEKNAEYTISLCDSSFDTTLAVFASCDGEQLACNDDYCNYQSKLNIDLIAGQRYLIRIAGYDGDVGGYTLEITENICIPPDAAAQPLPFDGAVEIDTQTALAWNGQPLPQAPKRLNIINKIIYGDDDRVEQYQITAPAMLAAGDATVAILPSLYLTNNYNGTYDLPSETFAQYYQAMYGRPLCDDEPFRDQPNPSLCSGVLVAPDIIATAGHCIDNQDDCSNSAFVFGFVMLNATTPVITIDQSQIYYGSEIIERVQTEYGPDWILIRLDRKVTDHKPISVRRSGQIANDTDVTIISYPMGLPRKYASNATVRDNSEPSYFQSNLDNCIGSSGAPVINSQTMQLEGLLVRGNVDFEENGTCDRSRVCPDEEGCPYFEEVTRVTEFSEYIPSCDVYLSDNPDQLVLIASDVTSDTYDPDPLECGTTYYWQIVSKERCDQTISPMFSFTTAPAGDLDASCDVGLTDLTEFAGNWLSDECTLANRYCDGADINKNGTVELTDLAAFAQKWLATYP